MEATTSKKFMRIADLLSAKGYRVGHQVGEGTYAKVRTIERVSDGRMCAVKIVERWKVRNDYLKKFMPRELDLILRLKHDNVVCTFDILQSRDYVFQIMQYAENGDVLQMIHRHGHLSEEVAKKIFRDMTRGMKYMHDMNVAHRDLKCENILLAKGNSAVICDFGFARAFGRRNKMCTTFCGSTAYASPELLKGVPYDPKVSDVWSMGIILFTMLCGSMPFDDFNVTKMVHKQMKKEIAFPPKVTSKISDTCKQFILSILEPDIKKRTTVDDLFTSDFLSLCICSVDSSL